MAAAMFTRWRTAIRDSEKTRVTHVAVSDDSAAFAAGQTSANPTGGATTALVKAATKTDVDASTFDATINLGSGDTTMHGKKIYTVAPCDGAASSNALGRVVRGTAPDVGIGFQLGDTYTIGVRVANSDVS